MEFTPEFEQTTGGVAIRVSLSAGSSEARHCFCVRNITSFRRRNGGVHGGSK